jgi:hypothetical protein
MLSQVTAEEDEKHVQHRIVMLDRGRIDETDLVAFDYVSNAFTRLEPQYGADGWRQGGLRALCDFAGYDGHDGPPGVMHLHYKVMQTHYLSMGNDFGCYLRQMQKGRQATPTP